MLRGGIRPVHGRADPRRGERRQQRRVQLRVLRRPRHLLGRWWPPFFNVSSTRLHTGILAREIDTCFKRSIATKKTYPHVSLVDTVKGRFGDKGWRRHHKVCLLVNFNLWRQEQVFHVECHKMQRWLAQGLLLFLELQLQEKMEFH